MVLVIREESFGWADVVWARRKSGFTTDGDAPHPGSGRELIASRSPLRMEPRQTAGAMIEFTPRRAAESNWRRARGRCPAAGRAPARRPGCRPGGRPARPAPTGRPPGASRSDLVAAPRRGARSTPPAPPPRTPAARSNRSTLPRSVDGCPAWANSQSRTPVTASVSGSTSRFLGLRSLCTRQLPLDRVEQRLCLLGHLAQARELRRGPVVQRDPLALRPSDGRSASNGRSAGRRRRTARGRSIGMPPRAAASSPTARPSRAWPAASRSGSSRSPRTPGRNEVTSSAGWSLGRHAAAYLQHLGHRQQPAHQPQQRRVDLGRLVAAVAVALRAGRCGPPAAPPPPRRGRSRPTSRRRAASARRSPRA